MATEALVTPKLLKWARERQGQSTDEIAEKLKVDSARVKAWERGEARPSLKQALHLAHRLNVPFGYLYLKTPPRQDLPLPDLRTMRDRPTREPSTDLLDVVNDALSKQEWYREYQEAEGAKRVPFIGRFKAGDDPQVIADDIRRVIGFDEVRHHASSWDDFLRLLVGHTEEVGVLVLRSGVVENNTRRKLSVGEFRGFAISDEIAPLVFINSQDARAAQIFTLVHELAHLWIGLSGVSNPEPDATPADHDGGVERVCNRTAAEALLPREDFITRWDRFVPIRTNLRALAARYRVSAVVVLRHAYDVNLIVPDAYWNLRQALESERREPAQKGEGGGEFYATLLARSSRNLATALTVALAEGRILHRDAARLLNVHVGTLHGIGERVLGAGPALSA